MTYNFDEIVDRTGTGCHRWDSDLSRDRIGIGQADMDFAVAPEIREALLKRLEHPVYGYQMDEIRRYDAVRFWQESRHGNAVEKDEIKFIGSVITGMCIAIQALTKPGDAVITQPPVYQPFPGIIEKNGRVSVDNRLLYRDGEYAVDFDGLDRVLTETGATMLLLCSPHNPVGKAYTREELKKIVEICASHHAYVLADETHADFYFHGNRHNAIFTVSPLAEKWCLQFCSTSKSFNLPGNAQAYVIIKNPEIMEKFAAANARNGEHENIFAMEAMIAAYTQCGDWMDQLCAYLSKLSTTACDFINSEIPGWRVRRPDAGFFLWPESDKPIPEIFPYIADEAKVALRDGIIYHSEPGVNNMRICFGTSEARLMEALRRIEKAMKAHR